MCIRDSLICDAYDRGYDQSPSIDTQTFDNLFDNVCNAKETYLSINCKGVRQIVEGKIELQETIKWDIKIKQQLYFQKSLV